jgi:hypothetical protein
MMNQTLDQNDQSSENDINNQSMFGKSNMSSVPKTLGNVFSQEWRDLLKYIAVSKGTTKVPKGMD